MGHPEVRGRNGNRNRTIVPRQPFMVALSDSYLKLVYNRSGIALFYQFETDSDTDYISKSVPDGCIDIIFHHDHDGQCVGADYYGTVLEPHAMRCYPGCTHFGIRFQPGTAPAFSQGPMSDFVDSIIPFEDAATSPMGQRLPAEIASCRSFRQKVELFLRSSSGDWDRPDENYELASLQTELVSSVVQAHGNVKVAELSRSIGYSSSYINKVFSRSVGISTKRFCEIVRFQQLLNCLESPDRGTAGDMDWGTLAQSLGFYDQAHMINDFKRFSGHAPRAFLKKLDDMHFAKRLNVINNPVAGEPVRSSARY